MIPQYEFIVKTKRIDKNVILYIVAMTGYTVLYVAYLGHEYRTRPYRYSLRSAAAAVQLLLHCDFFYRIYPLLNPDDQSEESNRSCLERIYSMLYCRKSKGDVESVMHKTGHLANNVGNVVLEPSDITEVDRDKVIFFCLLYFDEIQNCAYFMDIAIHKFCSFSFFFSFRNVHQSKKQHDK